MTTSVGKLSPITEAASAISNLEKLYQKILTKLKQTTKNTANESRLKIGNLESACNSKSSEPLVCNPKPQNQKQNNTPYQDKVRKKHSHGKLKRKRSKTTIKLKSTQPHQLRKLPETEGEKKVFGFGSFITLPDKPDTQKRQPIKRPDWRTRAMLLRIMKLNSKATAPLPIKSKSSTTVSRKSSYMRKPLENPPDESAALTYVQSKPKLFVPCRSASRSFNLSLNLQEIKVKERNMKKQAREILSENKKDECPAMHRSCMDFPINRDEMWGTPCVSATCTCFPGNYESTPVLPPISNRLKKLSKSHQGVFVDTFVDKLKKEWKSMSSEVGSVLNTQYLSREEQIKHIKSLIPQLKTREGQLREVESVVKEMKKMKEKLISLEVNYPTHRKTDGLKLVLKRIHSAL